MFHCAICLLWYIHHSLNYYSCIIIYISDSSLNFVLFLHVCFGPFPFHTNFIISLPMPILKAYWNFEWCM